MVVTVPAPLTHLLCLHSGKVSEKKRSKCDQTGFWLLLWQIAGLLKDNEKIHASPAAAPSDDDSEIKKIKKVKKKKTFSAQVLRNWPKSVSIPGPELLTGLDLQKEVEDNYPGLHPLTACREHEEEEPGCVQHVGLGGWVRPAASHPGEQLFEAPPHGCELQEAPHHPRWCQQHIPEQVWTLSGLQRIFFYGFFISYTFLYIFEHAAVWGEKNLSWSLKLTNCKSNQRNALAAAARQIVREQAGLLAAGFYTPTRMSRWSFVL